MRLVIETVGNYNSGLGHLTRMGVLADALKHYDVIISDGRHVISEVDLVIIDVDTEHEAFLRVQALKEA